MSRQDPLSTVLRKALWLKCPRCHEGEMFQGGFSVSLKEKCSNCDLKFEEHDSGDGPAVFIIFILGFTIVPLAVVCYHLLNWPEWIHYTLWPAMLLAGSVYLLKPLKSLLISLKYYYDAGEDLSNHDQF